MVAQTIRVACIGSNATYGEKMANRVRNNYPAQLQYILGGGYEVRNFGLPESSPYLKSERTYTNSSEYKNALSFEPNILLMEFGSIESKASLRAYLSDFKKDYKELINQFRLQKIQPRIVLLLPLPAFTKDTIGINDFVITREIIPRIQEIAYETKTELIDLHSLFIDNAGVFPDSVHLSSNGATIISKRLYDVVRMKEKKDFDLFRLLKPAKLFSSFYGFEMATFKFSNRECKIVKPKKAVIGLPWVWRARFWGHEPQTDIALLERGFHLVYCDVAELYGNSESIKIWNQFYELMRKSGLGKKASLEGMSRGGVYIYNWAMANPDKVACIYADAPVLDLKSWPGGKGKGPGSSYDWEIFKKDYQFNEESALQFSGSPLNKAARIAKLGIPMLHVVGDDDEVVPVEENTGPFERIIKENGGIIRVIHKPGVKHHPHSLANPTPIVEFILRANLLKTNFAVVAMPGTEYRSGAGWIEGKDWWAQLNDIDSLLMNSTNPDIIFLGNSITQGIGGRRTYVTYKPGLAVFDSVFARYKWETAGISGDRTQNILWRIQNGKYTVSKPRLIVLTIGVNNFNEDDSPSEIVDGIRAIVNYLRTQIPGTKIILSGLLPTGLQKDSDRRIRHDEIHRLLSKLTAKDVTYFPLTNTFVQPDGSLSLNDYSSDGIHLVEGGYKKWANAIYPIVDNLLR